MTRAEKIKAAHAAKTAEQKAERAAKIRAACAARSAEAEARRQEKRQATLAAKTEADKERMRQNLKAALVRTPEEQAAINAKRAATRAARPPEWHAANVAKRLAALAAKSPEEREARRQARKAARTPEQIAAYKASMQAARDAETPEQRAARVAKIRAAHRAKTDAQATAAVSKAQQTMLQRYGTTCSWKLSKQAGTCAEDKVRAFLDSLGFKFVEARLPGSRQGLDGLDAEAKLAFEYNGLYWHCEDSPSPRGADYHRQKLRACQEAGIRLFSIFEDEWIHRNAQVRGFLRAALGKNSVRLHGRKVEVREIDDKEAQAFYEAYHIQGATHRGSMSAGLFHGADLVGAMTFGRHHRGLDITVLTRLCFKDDVTVVGGSAKLFQFLVGAAGVKEVISWSDNRWSEGGVYKALGFVQTATLDPDYSYVSLTQPDRRISKQSQKKGAVNCPEGMTEKQWAQARGLSRVWDCGKTRWTWKA